MNPPWWGIPVILVVGALVVWFGWWRDRRRNRAASEGFTTEQDLAAQPEPTGLSEADLSGLLAARPDDATAPAGLADAAFLTHPARGVAAVTDPLVLVTDADLDDQALVLPVLAAAREDGRSLVLVAPGFGFTLLETLRANTRSGRVTCVPVELADPDLLERLAAATGGRVVPGSDLASGWLPPGSLGSCAWWVADREDSWVGTSEGPAPSTIS